MEKEKDLINDFKGINKITCKKAEIEDLTLYIKEAEMMSENGINVRIEEAKIPLISIRKYKGKLIDSNRIEQLLGYLTFWVDPGDSSETVDYISLESIGASETIETLVRKILTFEKIIRRYEVVKRGFGRCTLAIFHKNNGFDYAELCRPTDSEYQSSVCAIDKQERILGKTLWKACVENYDIKMLEGKWHRAKFSQNGEIISLRS